MKSVLLMASANDPVNFASRLPSKAFFNWNFRFGCACHLKRANWRMTLFLIPTVLWPFGCRGITGTTRFFGPQPTRPRQFASFRWYLLGLQPKLMPFSLVLILITVLTGFFRAEFCKGESC